MQHFDDLFSINAIHSLPVHYKSIANRPANISNIMPNNYINMTVRRPNVKVNVSIIFKYFILILEFLLFETILCRLIYSLRHYKCMQHVKNYDIIIITISIIIIIIIIIITIT